MHLWLIQKCLKQLQDDGFNEVDSPFSRENNTTALQIQYENIYNETAQINARFVNGSVEHVELVREQERNLYPVYFIGILILLVLAYLVYNKYSGKKEQKILVEEKISLQEENLNFREEAGKFVEKQYHSMKKNSLRKLMELLHRLCAYI